MYRLYGEVRKLELNTFTVAVPEHFRVRFQKLHRGGYKKPIELKMWGCFYVLDNPDGVPELVNFRHQQMQLCENCGKATEINDRPDCMFCFEPGCYNPSTDVIELGKAKLVSLEQTGFGLKGVFHCEKLSQVKKDVYIVDNDVYHISFDQDSTFLDEMYSAKINNFYSIAGVLKNTIDKEIYIEPFAILFSGLDYSKKTSSRYLQVKH